MHSILLSVDTPARYVGGEFGEVVKADGVDLRVAVCFPDLYEIGMSNTAIKLIYSAVNAMDRVACERVFAVGRDFEGALRAKGLPLVTLETGTPLNRLDMLCFSVGYEMLATNVLQVLDLGGVPLLSRDRGGEDPIVVAGGPGVANPVPVSSFYDAVYIGEMEGGFPGIIERDRVLRVTGASREERLAEIHGHPSIWHPGKDGGAHRAIWNGFGRDETAGAGFPVPNIRVTQDHGVVEIMRGCPQGCRFCHAGVYYRPYRMKSHARVEKEVEHLVNRYGYRDITLSSLSSGDYREIAELIDRLDARFGSRMVAFQLPSLRVNSVSLPLIEQLSKVKKAALTFAVESGDELHQRALNKLVPVEKTETVLREAWDRGWRRAKFYFMIGLPLGGLGAGENDAILTYLERLQRAVKMEFSVNVGLFVPKPHTPFQWARQLSETEALRRFSELKRSVSRRVKLNYPDPFLSILEGIIARGNEETGSLILGAYRAGCRLDAWDEHVQKETWRSVLKDHPGQLQVIEGFEPGSQLPWDGVLTGVQPRVLVRELERSVRGELTERCEPECRERCGVCNRKTTVGDLRPSVHGDAESAPSESRSPVAAIGGRRRDDKERVSRHALLVRFARSGTACYLAHLATLRLFERVWYRAGIPVAFTDGFHRKPRFSFAQPLPVGIHSEDEYVLIEVQKTIQLESTLEDLRVSLPGGFTVFGVALVESGERRPPSPMSLYAGARYRLEPDDGCIVADESAEDVETVAPDSVEFTLRTGGAPGVGKFLTRLYGERFAEERRVSRIATLGESEEGRLVPLYARYAPMVRSMSGVFPD